jgi:DHA3 family multidrug efflux protein-like MFS transporter
MKIKHHEQTIFHHLLWNNFIAGTTNAFIWFALTYWVYLETRSVLATSWIAGLFTIVNMFSALFFGAFVDHHTKKNVMITSSIGSLMAYTTGALIFFTHAGDWSDPLSPRLWALIIVMMVGSMLGNLRNISMTTLITLLFRDKEREKANGKVATINGLSFALTSVASGLVIGFLGMNWVIISSIVLTGIALFHIFFIPCPEEKIREDEEKKTMKFDFRWTLALVRSVPGYLPLIFLVTFNNFLGGVFMALMDAYGLSLVSVQTWGIMWGFLSFAFIIGGTIVARRGVGKNPVRTLVGLNMVTWFVCIFFTMNASIVLFIVGIISWMILMPIIEASEQTIVQKVIPYEKQGRVVGFAQSIESAASPLTTFMIGPIAQYVTIPFMTTGAGVTLIGSWFWTGDARGMALIFCIAGLLGFIVSVLARFSPSYHKLSKAFRDS